MQRPLYTTVVVCLWLVTSGWLVVVKILPDFRPGSPPGQQALYAAEDRLVPVAWTALWNGQPVGWALTVAQREDDGGLIVESRLHFDQLPLGDGLPTWAGVLVKRALRGTSGIVLDARGRLSIDPRGRLTAFTSNVSLPAGFDSVDLDGRVDDGRVDVTIRAGDVKYDATRHLPDTLMIGDELSPQATLPGLFEGRRWTVPMCSPLRLGHSPIEILHAEVGGQELVDSDEGPKRAFVVSYRQDPSSPAQPRSRLWVEPSGRVLKHETVLFGATLSFLRHGDERAAALAATHALAAETVAPAPPRPGREP